MLDRALADSLFLALHRPADCGTVTPSFGTKETSDDHGHDQGQPQNLPSGRGLIILALYHNQQEYRLYSRPHEETLSQILSRMMYQLFRLKS